MKLKIWCCSLLIGGACLSIIATTSCSYTPVVIDITFNLNDYLNWDTSSNNIYLHKFPPRDYTASPFGNKQDDPTMLEDINALFSPWNIITGDTALDHDAIVNLLDEGGTFGTTDYWQRHYVFTYYKNRFSTFFIETNKKYTSGDGTLIQRHDLVSLKPGMYADVGEAGNAAFELRKPAWHPGEERPFEVYSADYYEGGHWEIDYQPNLDDVFHINPLEFTNVTFPTS